MVIAAETGRSHRRGHGNVDQPREKRDRAILTRTRV